MRNEEAERILKERALRLGPRKMTAMETVQAVAMLTAIVGLPVWALTRGERGRE